MELVIKEHHDQYCKWHSLDTAWQQCRAGFTAAFIVHHDFRDSDSAVHDQLQIWISVWPAGSSSGSAVAVASRVAPFALCEDTGGEYIQKY